MEKIFYAVPFAFIGQKALAQGYGGYGGHMMRWGFAGLGLLGGLVTLIFWILVIVAFIYLIKHLTRPNELVQKDRSLEILRERYAKGEVSAEEYKKMKEELKK